MHCDNCGRSDVPDGVFCTNCGARGGHTGNRKSHFAAHPGEHVFHPAFFTTLFPHLGHRKLHEFRWVFLGGVTGVFALFFAGFITAALCISVLLLPILYLQYLYEAQVYRDEPLPVVAALAFASVGIGIGVTIGTDRLISDTTKLSFAVTGGSLVVIGVVIPLIQEAAKPLAALAVRARPAFRDETMDGLVFGVAAGLGFGVGESFVRFSKILTDLPVRTRPGDWIYPLLTTAVLLPLLQGVATGLVCAAIWRIARGNVDALAIVAIPVALAGHVAFTLVSQVLLNHGWSQPVVVAWQLGIDLAMLLVLRSVLHWALLEEGGETTSAERYCAHCHVLVQAEGFCPSCGAALSAVPISNRTVEGVSVAVQRLSTPVFVGGTALVVVLVGLLAALVTWVFHPHAKPPCTADCPPPQASAAARSATTFLAEPHTFQSTVFGFHVDYPDNWKLQDSNGDGALFSTRYGQLEIVGTTSTSSATQLIQQRIGSFGSAQLPDLASVGAIHGAHIGSVEGEGELYSATFTPSSGAGRSEVVRIAIIVARKGKETVMATAFVPYDAHSGRVLGDDIDYALAEFRWPGG